MRIISHSTNQITWITSPLSRVKRRWIPVLLNHLRRSHQAASLLQSSSSLPPSQTISVASASNSHNFVTSSSNWFLYSKHGELTSWESAKRSYLQHAAVTGDSGHPAVFIHGKPRRLQYFYFLCLCKHSSFFLLYSCWRVHQTCS